jgi:neutral ceramidase
MRLARSIIRSAFAALSLTLAMPGAGSAQGGALQVGTAKVNITPRDVEPVTIRDSLYVRAIVIDNGTTRAALLNVDKGNAEQTAWENASREIAAFLNIPIENIAISATHTHSGAGRDSAELRRAYTEAVRQARSRMQPVVMGFARGNAYLNVNRDAINPQTRLWYQGPNPEGVSDKTVSVLSFWTPEGRPIAAYYSYAMHPVNYYRSGYVSADFPGEAARHMEQVLGADFVPIFVQAPSGDQNPLFSRIGSRVPAPTRLVPLSRPSRASMPPSTEPDSALRIIAGVDEAVRAAGVILGQEVMRVMFANTSRSSDARIWAGTKTVTCPGRTRLDNAREGVQGQYSEGPDVNLRVGLMRIGSVALPMVNAEVYTGIGLRLRKESPLANLMTITLTNGSAGSGYVPDDESFGHNTFQVLGSRLKPGCAEGGIAHAVLDLTNQSMN